MPCHGPSFANDRRDIHQAPRQSPVKLCRAGSENVPDTFPPTYESASINPTSTLYLQSLLSLHVAVETLSQLAVALNTNVEELIGTPATRTTSKRGPAPKLQQQLERLYALPEAKQRLVREVLGSLLAQTGR